MLTSNLSFSEWPKVFAGDEKLTTALLDRLAASEQRSEAAEGRA